MALLSTPADFSVDDAGSLIQAYNADRKRIIVQNRDASVTLRLYKLPANDDTAPDDVDEAYLEIGPGEVWEEEGYLCCSNPIFLASSSGTVVAYTEIT